MLANICIQYFFPDRTQVREILPAVRPCTWHSKVQQIISYPSSSQRVDELGRATLIMNSKLVGLVYMASNSKKQNHNTLPYLIQKTLP
jgi:hypothetical protein